MFYDGLTLKFFPILIHRYNSFNRPLKDLYCLIFSFNLNFTASSLRRNSNFTFKYFPSEYSQLSLLTRDLLSKLLLSFCRQIIKYHIVYWLTRSFHVPWFLSSIPMKAADFLFFLNFSGLFLAFLRDVSRFRK